MDVKHEPGSHIEPQHDAGTEPVNQSTFGDALSVNGMQQQVQEKPVSSVAIAVGVGIGAGLLLSTLLTSGPSRRERLASRLGSYLSSGNLRSSIEDILPNAFTDRYKS